MPIEETIVTEAIATTFFEKFKSAIDLDVAIVGAGPSGLTCAWKLSEKGLNVAIFERKLSIGGGMWGGGVTWNIIVVQEEGKHILDEAGIPCKEYKKGYYTADAVLATTQLAAKAALAGTKIFNCMSVEDVVLRVIDGEKRVTGIVVNSSPVELAGLHVDPVVIKCKYLIEATGHDLEVVNTLIQKNDVRLFTPSGKIEGEKSMWAEVAEAHTIDNTKEVFPGVFVAGMAANACFGSYRMGPIFGGMLLSGVKVAEEIIKRIK
ncbi:sulfide-dependent adenosine diphosphate thiazole synthase [Desulfothermus okinawensis JCM 13304]